MSIALEGSTVQNQRKLLLDRISKLEDDSGILRATVGTVIVSSSSETQKLFSFSHFNAPQRRCDIRMLLIQW
ncbi:hypothetical protein PspLS_11705 [Pyricularia sp. CBS 133598]|nr:hypothetical protein PspLS_11705 [Pyricularia sp. CBS 133598]